MTDEHVDKRRKEDGGKKRPVVRVGGVPEHFNLPWHIGIDEEIFHKHNVEVDWVEQKLGTGAMLAALRSGECDIIVALTEGLVTEMCRTQVTASKSTSTSTSTATSTSMSTSTSSSNTTDSAVKLVSGYVSTPLCWAVTVGKDSKYESIEDLKGACWGISKEGSGSHIMPLVIAHTRDWKEEVTFKPVGNFANLRKSVNDGETAAFMWERFMTKPFHDSGEVNKVGTFEPPWPAFLIASTEHYLSDPENRDTLTRCLEALTEACGEFKNKEAVIPVIANKFHLSDHDASQWYDGVNIEVAHTVKRQVIEGVVTTLKAAKMIAPHDYSVDQFMDERFYSLVE